MQKQKNTEYAALCSPISAQQAKTKNIISHEIFSSERIDKKNTKIYIICK